MPADRRGHPLERIYLRSLGVLAGTLGGLTRARLWLQILVGMALGLGTGIALGPSVGWIEPRLGAVLGEWLALPGYLFLTLVQMIVVPLVVASVIRGLAASSDVQQLRTAGIGLGIYFLATTVVAVILGIVLGLTVRPGRFIDPQRVQGLASAPAQLEVELPGAEGETDLSDLPRELISILPENPLGAMVEGEMLQVVLFSLIVGLALISLQPRSSTPLLELMGSVQAVCMAVVGWVMRLAPLAVFGLMARAMIRTGIEALAGLGVYAACVVGGLALLMGVFLLIAVTLGRQRPGRFLAAIREAQLLAFSTDSSAATLPVSIRTAEEALGVRRSLAQLVLPLGATVNMGGTALYQGLATIFMAQLFGMDLPLSTLVALIVTALGASIGAPATPGAGIVILATVLTGAGVPLAGLALILGLDQILERVRCVLNVTGDLVAAVVMERFARGRVGRLEEMTAQAEVEKRRERTDEDVVTLPAGP